MDIDFCPPSAVLPHLGHDDVSGRITPRSCKSAAFREEMERSVNAVSVAEMSGADHQLPDLHYPDGFDGLPNAFSHHYEGVEPFSAGGDMDAIVTGSWFTPAASELGADNFAVSQTESLTSPHISAEAESFQYVSDGFGLDSITDSSMDTIHWPVDVSENTCLPHDSQDHTAGVEADMGKEAMSSLAAAAYRTPEEVLSGDGLSAKGSRSNSLKRELEESDSFTVATLPYDMATGYLGHDNHQTLASPGKKRRVSAAAPVPSLAVYIHDEVPGTAATATRTTTETTCISPIAVLGDGNARRYSAQPLSMPSRSAAASQSISPVHTEAKRHSTSAITTTTTTNTSTSLSSHGNRRSKRRTASSGAARASMSSSSGSDNTSPVEDGERRKKFLERNRIAASKCRQKRKEIELSLQRARCEVEQMNQHLIHQRNQLISEVAALKAQLMLHGDCSDIKIDRWVASEASDFTNQTQVNMLAGMDPMVR